jgi:uncharacterized membrane protein YphA (DoxX/SURF4 family)
MMYLATTASSTGVWAARWLAVLRIVVGAWFLKAAYTKLALGWALGIVPYPTASGRFVAVHARRVAEFAAGNPLDWYRAFLESIVLPHAATFAALQAIGEVAVGLGLVLGLLTRPSALVGLFLSLNFGLATQWMSPGQQGFHVLLVATMLAFLGVGAGRVLGVDAWLRRRHPGSALLRLLT